MKYQVDLIDTNTELQDTIRVRQEDGWELLGPACCAPSGALILTWFKDE